DQTSENGDAMKLSQVPLNHLFEYAVTALVPLKKDLSNNPGVYDPFAISQKLKGDFDAFMFATGAVHRKLSDWMEVYLAWRWAIRNRYAEVSHVRLATTDRELLLLANRKLISDAEALLAPLAKPVGKRVVKDLVFDPKAGIEIPINTKAKLDPEATVVLKRAISLGEPSMVVANFFDRYVHDSYAGFCKSIVEPTGYWRYRKGFQGTDDAINASIGDDNLSMSATS
ncbi:hypothetical protein AB4Z11_26985, partial [Pseudoduganella sp. RAF53_2]